MNIYIFNIEARRIGSSKFISTSAQRSGRSKEAAFKKLNDEFTHINLINSVAKKKPIELDIDP